MGTSVHIPKPLLQAVDRRARALRVSRNRFIVTTLQKEIEGGADWSPGFFERLEPTEEIRRAVDEMLVAVRAARRSKETSDL